MKKTYSADLFILCLCTQTFRDQASSALIYRRRRNYFFFSLWVFTPHRRWHFLPEQHGWIQSAAWSLPSTEQFKSTGSNSPSSRIVSPTIKIHTTKVFQSPQGEEVKHIRPDQRMFGNNLLLVLLSLVLTMFSFGVLKVCWSKSFLSASCLAKNTWTEGWKIHKAEPSCVWSWTMTRILNEITRREGREQ